MLWPASLQLVARWCDVLVPCWQVESASYVWLPLLPRGDGLGYELQYEEKWRPSDFRDRAQQPLKLSNQSASTETAAAQVQSAGPIGAAAKATPATPPADLIEWNQQSPAVNALSSLEQTSAGSSAMATVLQSLSERTDGVSTAALG